MPTVAEASTPNLSPGSFLAHYRTIRDAARAHDEAGMALARAKKAAKADGVNLDALKIVEKARKLDDDEAELQIRQAFQYASWLGKPLGSQASLFPEQEIEPESKAQAEQQSWEAGDAGYRAGTGGKLRSDNPFPEGSPLHQAWDQQFMRGLKILAAQLRAKEDDQADKKADKKAKRSDVPSAGARGRRGASQESASAATH